ncbi:hypothetical protein Tco_0474902 [Tanacetum coccineum]
MVDSTDHLTKEHLEHAAVKKTLSKLKALSPLKPTPKKDPMIPKPFKECKIHMAALSCSHHSGQLITSRAQKVMQSTLMKMDPFQMMNSLNQGVKVFVTLKDPPEFTEADDHPARSRANLRIWNFNTNHY